MSIDDHIEAIRQAYKQAQQTDGRVYIADASAFALAATRSGQ